MVQTVTLPNGESAEFPDEMSPEQMESIVVKQFPPTNSQATSQQSPSNGTMNLFGMQKPNISRLRDIPGITDPKELAKGALQSAGIIGSALVPEIPAIMEGGSLFANAVNALSKIGAGAATGAMASPDHPILGAATGAAFPAASSAIGKAGNIFNKYFAPETTAKNLLSTLGGNQSIVENINELSKRLGFGQSSAKVEALTPKREVMALHGEDRIVPSQITGNELTNKIANIFAYHPDEIDKNSIAQLGRQLKNYYNDKIGIDDLVEKGEDIFNSPGLDDNDISKIEDMLIPGKAVKGNYLAIKNADQHYSEALQDAHDAYVKNPTFSNSDALRSKLFKRINELSKRQKANTLTDNQEKELNLLTKNRSAIIEDQDNLINTFSPENQQKYGTFNRLWRNDVRAYEDAGSTIKNLKNGFLSKVTPEKITNAFSFPELKPQVQKVLNDIGPSGINNIVYNEIARTPSARGILNTLNNLESHKGFSPYLTPEIKNFSNQLKTQLRNRNALLWGLGGIGSVGAADLAYHGAKKVLNTL